MTVEALKYSRRFIVSVFSANRDDDAAGVKLTFIVLGLFFRKSQTDQCARQPCRRSAGGRTRQDGRQGAAGDGRPNGWQEPGDDADAPQRADAGPGCNSRRRPDCGFAALALNILGAFDRLPVACGHADLVLAEASAPQLIDRLLRLLTVLKDADCRGVSPFHDKLL